MDIKENPGKENLGPVPGESNPVPPEGGQVAEETIYLDLDGDGVPDAVQTVEAVAVDRTGDGVADEVEVHEELASKIGVDGVPERVSVTERVTVELPDLTGS